MSIRIRSVAFQAAGGATVPADGPLDKIVKSVPSQVIAFYTAALIQLGGCAPLNLGTSAASATTSASTATSNPKLWLPFVFGLILTPILTWRQTNEPDKPPAYVHIIIATISFIVWAFATGGPFACLGFWSPAIAGIVLAAYTVLLGVLPQN